MQRTNTNKMEALINEFIREQGLEEGLLRVRIYKVWELVIGQKAASYIISKYFNKGVLYCTVSSSMLRSQLSFQKKEIISRMNSMLNGEIISDIVFRQFTNLFLAVFVYKIFLNLYEFTVNIENGKKIY